MLQLSRYRTGQLTALGREFSSVDFLRTSSTRIEARSIAAPHPRLIAATASASCAGRCDIFFVKVWIAMARGMACEPTPDRSRAISVIDPDEAAAG